jgi:hypothetical protein
MMASEESVDESVILQAVREVERFTRRLNGVADELVTITEHHLSLLQARIDKMVAKAAKHGAECNVRLEVVERFVRSGVIQFVDMDGDKMDRSNPSVQIPMLRVQLVGTTFSVGSDWQCLGSVEVGTSENIVRLPEGSDVDAEKYRTTKICDHCKTARRRVNMWILRHKETGVEALIGRNCLADYLRDPTAVKQALRTARLFWDAQDLLLAIRSGAGGAFYVVEETVAMSRCVVRHFGYRKASEEDLSTSGMVAILTSGQPLTENEKKQFGHVRLEDQDEVFAAAALAWIRDPKNTEGNNYLQNLRVACSGETMRPRNRRLVCSLVVAYTRHLEGVVREEAKRKERAARPKSVAFGEAKKRYDFQSLTVLFTRFIENDWGGKTVVGLLDEQGRRFTWFASGVHDYDPGDIVSGKATVKGHEVYQGEEQTLLTRAKFEVLSKKSDVA